MAGPQWPGHTRVPELLLAVRGNSSERKLWLFACACCRLVWDRLPEVSRQVVEEVERHAEGENRDERLATLLREYHPDLVAVPGIPGGPRRLKRSASWAGGGVGIAAAPPRV